MFPILLSSTPTMHFLIFYLCFALLYRPCLAARGPQRRHQDTTYSGHCMPNFGQPVLADCKILLKDIRRSDGDFDWSSHVKWTIPTPVQQILEENEISRPCDPTYYCGRTWTRRKSPSSHAVYAANLASLSARCTVTLRCTQDAFISLRSIYKAVSYAMKSCVKPEPNSRGATGTEVSRLRRSGTRRALTFFITHLVFVWCLSDPNGH